MFLLTVFLFISGLEKNSDDRSAFWVLLIIYLKFPEIKMSTAYDDCFVLTYCSSCETIALNSK